MISSEIEFHAPGSLAEALALLEGEGEDLTVLSGGMSLLPMMNLGIVRPEKVLSLNRVAELDHVTERGEELVVGATVRHARAATDPLILEHCPVLAAAASVIGDVQVRNRGTVGGSVAHADPAADYLPVLAAVGGRVVLTGPGGERSLPPDEFLIDLMLTTREPEELVTAVTLPKRPAGWRHAYRRLTRVEGSYAIVNAAAVVAGDGSAGRVALGGVGPKPALVDVGEQLRAGLDDAALAAVGEAAYEASDEASGDLMSDATYRREMAAVFARRAVKAAANGDAAPHQSPTGRR